jgi:hypothetical protein
LIGIGIRLIVVGYAKEPTTGVIALQTVTPSEVRTLEIIDSLKPVLEHCEIVPAGPALPHAVVVLLLDLSENVPKRVGRFLALAIRASNSKDCGPS